MSRDPRAVVWIDPKVCASCVSARARAFMLALLVAGCGGGGGGDTPTPPTDAPAFEWNLPKGFPRPLVPDDNPMSTAKVELGRRLFYDTRLSGNGTQSCASCHRQELAFTDGRGQAVGSTGELHPRGAQALANVAYAATLTWANPLLKRLEDQVTIPLFGSDPVELGLAGREDELLERLRSDAAYQRMFADAFPDREDPLSLDTVVKGLAAFERVLISGRSPYDRFVYDGDRSALSPAAQRGKDLFFSERLECAHCHGGLNFASSLTHAGAPNDPTPFENNGLYNIGGDGSYPLDNTGLYAFTFEPRDMGRFKPPSLRNVELTAPYMHDGSLATLDEVVAHYERGGRLIEEGPRAGDGRLSPYRSDLVLGFTLDPGERADLIAFLHSLTDRELVNDPSLSDPFDVP